jgi:putative transposase
MKKRHTPEQIVRKLREAEAQMAAGASSSVVARKLGISEATFHRWRNQYGGMKSDEMKRLKELEKENIRLKKIVADQAVDISILKEVSRENFSRARQREEPPSSTCDGSSMSLSVGRVRRSANLGRANATQVPKWRRIALWPSGWPSFLGRTPVTATAGCGLC